MAERVELLQGTLDLIVLRALSTMGPQHAYGLASRLEQVAEHPLMLNQGTLYPALLRLEQRGWIKGTWQRTESNREAKYYAITKAGTRALDKQAERWRRLAGLVDKLPTQLMGGKTPQLGQADMDRAERDVRRMEGIICSMTPLERRKPELIKATRKRRIAAGAGVQVQDVNRLLNQFEQMQGMMKKMKGGGLMKMMKKMGGLKNLMGGGGGGFPM